jgi:hypothetical protein
MGVGGAKDFRQAFPNGSKSGGEISKYFQGLLWAFWAISMGCGAGKGNFVDAAAGGGEEGSRGRDRVEELI